MNTINNYFLLLLGCIALINFACDDNSSSNLNSSNTNNLTSNNSSNNISSPDYAIVDTAQLGCYSDINSYGCMPSGYPYSGQDAQYKGNLPSYTDNGDGTVTDNVTGLMWIKTPDINNDGVINIEDKLTWSEIPSYVENLNEISYANYSDWRIPSIKELYSLINFNGTDPSNGDESNLIPFIDTDYFGFDYGDTDANERTIDSQYASSTLYVSTRFGQLLFGVNFADGRIKGYGTTMGDGSEKTFLLLCVRQNPSYGENVLTDNGDGTVSDESTSLMWAQNDSAEPMLWSDAFEYASEMNSQNYLGYNDWRIPSIKELQSIVDYTKSPDTTSSPAISDLFNSTSFINERLEEDWGYYWSSTTHLASNGTASAGTYISFGRALGYMNDEWVDVHGAGAQRSDPKTGDPADYPTGFGPQGDAIRIYNYVRLVRLGAQWDTSVLAPESCGNGSCDENETTQICPQDCVSTDEECGDGICSGAENEQSCPEDCLQGPAECSEQSDCELPENCPDEAAMGCQCVETIDGSVCIPSCETTDDCPPGPQGITLECNPDNLCAPPQN
ncbi:MAG: DUF1566 domain-containing protein [Deltaproteobacteria bacterium]|nr:DUF1566 domain-containing protein [Deltaproteobacteria bacterium]